MTRAGTAMAEPADINVDELRRRARRRLVGAVVLALAVAVIVPMLLETEQKPLGEDVAVKIPPIDGSKFVNRLSASRAGDASKGAVTAEPRDGEAAKGAAPGAASPTPPSAERTAKYDTRVPDNAPASAQSPAAPGDSAAPGATTPAKPPAETRAAEPSLLPAAPPAPQPQASGPPTSQSVPANEHKAVATGPSAAAAKVATSASPHEGFAVQLAAFADDKGANALAGRLKKAGYAAYTEPLNTSKGTLWRVRVGPYPSRESAVAARDRLKSEGQSGIVAAVK